MNSDSGRTGHIETLMRLHHVLSIIPVSRSTWYRGMNSGIYPKPVKLSDNIVAWRSSEIALVVESMCQGS